MLLSELIYRVSRLELPDVTDEEELTDLVATHQWTLVRDRFAHLAFNGYWAVFEPLKDAPEDPIFNLLSDDLADIHRDVKEGLLLYDQGKLDDGVWEWRFNYDIHWGRHLTGALHAIHSYFS